MYRKNTTKSIQSQVLNKQHKDPKHKRKTKQDLSTLEGGVGINWFSNRVVRKVSNGRGTCFWKDRWLGDHVLANTFPRLYALAIHKEAKIGDLWSLVNGEVAWNLAWWRQPFLWENNLIVNILTLLEGVSLGEDEDKWLWTAEEDGNFSVRSSYKVLEEIVLLEDDLSGIEEGVFAKLWKSPAPSKVVAFSWMTILNRIPTRSNLALRHVLAQGEVTTCVMCGHGNETTSHLFLHCDVASLIIWRKVFDWLEVNFITPQDLLVHFACWSDEVNSRRLRKAFWLIWHATLWMIWKERNARIFKNQMRSFEEVVDDIKAVSWFWSLSRLRIAYCLFYEWCWNPRECLYRRR